MQKDIQEIGGIITCMTEKKTRNDFDKILILSRNNYESKSP